MADTLRKRCYLLLSPDYRSSLAARLTNIGLSLLIIISVIAVIFETVEPIADSFGTLLLTIEIISMTVFIIEYAGRVWTAPENPAFDTRFGRLRYIITPMALVDILAILPAILMIFTSIDLRFIRIIRLLRLLKFSRYSSGLELMASVVRQQIGTFAAALAALACLLVFSAGIIFLLEHEAQPEVFDNLPKSLYWTIITLATVGYGDVVPITTGGKAFASVIALTGIGIVAVPAGILASAFSSELRRREESFRQSAAQHLSGHRLTEAVRRKLEFHQYELGLSDQQAANILNHVRDIHHKHLDDRIYCPHCHKPLYIDLSETPDS
ncbi:potassium channel family protein [Thalassospira sp.]|uniref:potassium channel family protein n=1 Tax=Thalassospira sp. TaxID=1912094 RepID=UPI002734F3E8|nr:potassium channel family protein [Thalassospira sp.]MDP2700254.1 potassium channel family protein [Thalassospira sp.]